MKMDELRKTMPWTHRLNPLNGVITILDRNGKEVPLFDFVSFGCELSQKLAITPDKVKEG